MMLQECRLSRRLFTPSLRALAEHAEGFASVIVATPTEGVATVVSPEY